ncbi:MAG: hypothetical protein RSC91_02735, partial [Clostridia bacterium]
MSALTFVFERMARVANADFRLFIFSKICFCQPYHRVVFGVIVASRASDVNSFRALGFLPPLQEHGALGRILFLTMITISRNGSLKGMLGMKNTSLGVTDVQIAYIGGGSRG